MIIDEKFVYSDNLRPNQAAAYLGLSRSTLAKLRMKPNRVDGPNFVKLGGSILYRKADLDHWIQSNVIAGS